MHYGSPTYKKYNNLSEPSVEPAALGVKKNSIVENLVSGLVKSHVVTESSEANAQISRTHRGSTPYRCRYVSVGSP
jgi:hypothetical protein